jgi:hypothetical protein
MTNDKVAKALEIKISALLKIEFSSKFSGADLIRRIIGAGTLIIWLILWIVYHFLNNVA